MTRMHRVALLGMALLAVVSAAPVRAMAADDWVQVGGEVVPAAKQQAARDCQSHGGWYDAAAGVCDVQGVK